MFAGQVQLPRGELPGPQELQIGFSQRGEFGQQRVECARGVARAMAKSVVRLKPKTLPPRENDAGPGNPVRFLTVDEMSHDVEGTECVRSLCAFRPSITDVA